MKKNILFIQGGGEKGYEVDAKLAASLQQELREGYNVNYPKMKTNETESDFGWLEQIGKEISRINDEIILTGHSLGASMLLKFLSENKIDKKISGVFLISTPFWSSDEDWVWGLKLKEDFSERLPKDVPVFLYHCRDDEVVPFDHLTRYRNKLPFATVREINIGGHQLNNSIPVVGKDIESIPAFY